MSNKNGFIVNYYINYARSMIKQIDHVKGIDDNLSDIKTLVFAAMLIYYGVEHIDEIYLSFLRTDFIECNGNMSSVIAKKYKLSDEDVMKLLSHCPGTFYAVDGFKNLKTNKYRFKRSIYTSSDVDRATVMKSVLHQMNHVINSFNSPVLKKRGSYVSRMGLSVEHFDSRRIEVLGLEEAINGLQIDEIMTGIESFNDCEIQDPGVRVLCESLFESSKDKEKSSDDLMTEIVRPLYEEDTFNRRVMTGRFMGDLGRIRNCFDVVVGTGSFSSFLASCDSLEKLDSSSDGFLTEKEKAKTLVKTYVDKCNNN